MGEMNASDFATLQKNADKLVALDLTDVTIKSLPTPNSLPTNAFAASNPMGKTALSTILLPKNLESIEENAFYRCINVKEITIPEKVAYIGSGAFAACIKLEKIVVLSKTPVPLKSNPFPTNTQITLEVPKGTESAYTNSEFWKELQHTTSKVFYNIQIDPDRTFQYSEREPLTKIEGPVGSATKTVMLGLPNFKPTSYKPNPTYRPGVAFKLYDNKQDVTNQLDPLDPTDFFNPGGYYLVKFYGNVTDPKYLSCPQNHIIDVVFHYDIKVKDVSGKSKVNFVNLNEVNVWNGVNMALFVQGSNERKTLYKEGCDYKFTVVSETPNMTPKVKIAGEVALPDENGIYVITNLQSDMEVEITMVPVEGAVLKPEEVIHIDKEEADGIVELGLSGEMTDKAFEHIRENFTSLETIDMSAIENSEIPSNAFAGMENLTNVVIPENVTSIGKNAFAGCSQLESLTLNSVDAIDAGAFDGCSSLTSITLFGNSQSDKDQSSTRVRNTTGINDQSFEGINPNCIIYLAEGLEKSISSKSNIVINSGGSRVASTDIVLTDGFAFNAPASFNLGEKNISLSVKLNYPTGNESKEWKGIVLPFVPKYMSDGKGNDYTIGTSGNHTVSILSFNEDAIILENQPSIEANKPYMIHLNGEVDDTVDFTFRANGSPATQADESLMFDVPMTPVAESITKAGKDFTLFGNYTSTNVAPDTYLLDDEGYSFNRIADEETDLMIAPFSVYAKANTFGVEDSFEVGKVNITGTDNQTLPQGEKIKLIKEGSNLVIISDVEQDIDIFAISGIPVVSISVKPGSNTVTLNPGVYIIDGIKVIF